jgi:Phospholipase_D-nuclease N-terminal
VSGLQSVSAAPGTGPPAAVFYVIVPILILAVAFDAYCLIDLRRARSVRHLPKWVWAIVILLSAPWGGLIYLFAGRDSDAGADLSRRPSQP